MKTYSLKRLLCLGPILALAFPATLSAQTNFLGGDLKTAGNWDNGLPASGNPGSVAVDGTHYSTIIGFGNGSVVAQTAGIIDCAANGFNMHNGGDWNMSGGAINCRYFLPNGGGGQSVFNLSGGTITLGDHTGSQHAGVANGGVLNISGSGLIDATEADQAPGTVGTIDIASDWTGSWTQGTYTIGNEWEGHFISGEITYAGMTIDAATFAATFTVTNGGMTLQLNNEPGTSYCPGDGVAPHTLCPCANNNNGSMGGCDWGEPAFPEGGVLGATGSDSMAANDTLLLATGVADNFGIFFGANNQVNSGNGNPLNDGLRCAGGGLVRLIPPTMASGNQMTLPSPVQTLDTGAAAGVTRRYQYWFRTPMGPCGQQANLTNGYEIVWLP